MRKVIRGHLYDTEKAKLLGSYESPLGPGNFGYYKEFLYRTKAGYYFIYGSGNAASPYRERVEQNTWGSGEAIVPVSLDSAKAWAEQKISAEEYEEIFGRFEQGTTGVSFYIPDGLLEKIDKARGEMGLSRTEFFLKAAREFLKQK